MCLFSMLGRQCKMHIYELKLKKRQGNKNIWSSCKAQWDVEGIETHYRFVIWLILTPT